MAQRVQVILEDDYDGGVADETITFAVDGTEYEIDLSEKNASNFRDAVGPWIAHARRLGGGRRSRRNGRSPGGSTNGSGPSTSEIRAWALANGHKVSSRGRVSADIREAYEKANG